jgi:hypothetical protein
MNETVSDKFRIFLEYVERHAQHLRAHIGYGWMASEMLEEMEKLEDGSTCDELLQLANVWEQQALAGVPAKGTEEWYFSLNNEAAGLMQCVQDIRLYVQVKRLRLSQNRSDIRRPV